MPGAHGKGERTETELRAWPCESQSLTRPATRQRSPRSGNAQGGSARLSSGMDAETWPNPKTEQGARPDRGGPRTEARILPRVGVSSALRSALRLD